MNCDKCLKGSKNLLHVTSFQVDKMFCGECIKPLFNCKECGLTEFEQTCMEGYEGLCDCCATWKYKCDLEEQWNRELVIYSQRVGEEYDFDMFCFDCDGETPNVKKYQLNGLPELTEVFDMIRGDYSEIYEDLENLQTGQLQLKF